MKPYEKLEPWKQECARYAESIGYVISKHYSIYLNNKIESRYEIFDLLYSDEYIVSFPKLIIFNDNIVTTNADRLINNFEKFKRTLNGIDYYYKKLKTDLQLHKMKKDFE